MERLTKRSNKTVHENGVCCTHYLSKECEERSGYCTDECPWEEAAWSRLADYEDLEEKCIAEMRCTFLFDSIAGRHKSVHYCVIAHLKYASIPAFAFLVLNEFI